MRESPTQRTLRKCRSNGWPADVAEHWVSSHLTRAVVDLAKRWRQVQTVKALDQLRDAIVALEHGLPGQRRDLFSCVDVVALDTNAMQIVGIQASATSTQRQRWNKIRIECSNAAAAWLRCGGRLEVWGWGQYVLKRGGKSRRWKETIIPITLTDLEEITMKPF